MGSIGSMIRDTADLCANIDCGAHGTCVVSTDGNEKSIAQCYCKNSFIGDTCTGMRLQYIKFFLLDYTLVTNRESSIV